MPLFGKVSDQINNKRQVLIGLGVFCSSTILSAVAPSWQDFLGAQCLQALGDSLVVPAQATLIRHLFPPDKIGWAFGWQGAVLAFASLVGPGVGGVIIQFISWRFLFVFMLVLGLISIAAAMKFIPSQEPTPPQRFFWRRIPLINSITLLALLVGVQAILLLGPEFAWCIVAAGGGIGLLLREHFGPPESCLFPPRMLHNITFVLATIRGFMFFLAADAIAFFVPSYLESYFKYMPSKVGAILLVEPIVMIILGGWGGRRANKAMQAVAIGCGLMIVSSLGLMINFSAWEVLALMGLFIMSGIGGALVVPAQNKIAMDHIEPLETGMYMGTFEMVQFIAGGFAGAAFGNMLTPTNTAIISASGFRMLLLFCAVGFLASSITLFPNFVRSRRLEIDT